MFKSNLCNQTMLHALLGLVFLIVSDHCWLVPKPQPEILEYKFKILISASQLEINLWETAQKYICADEYGVQHLLRNNQSLKKEAGIGFHSILHKIKEVLMKDFNSIFLCNGSWGSYVVDDVR